MNSIRTFLFAAALTLLAAAPPAWAETAGSLDMNFNPNVTGGSGVLSATAVQLDGKVIIGGNFTSVDGKQRTNLARLNPDGSVDASFTATTDWDVTDVVIQADGKILLGGAFNTVNNTPRKYLARLNPDGSLDASFNPGTGPSAPVNCVAMQADGKILLGGSFATVNGIPRNDIARLNPNGSVDTTFNPGSGTNEAGVTSVAVQADGKIVLGGTFTAVNGTPLNRIARLNPDGSVDATFRPGSGANNFVYCAAMQADGKIVIGGAFTTVNGMPFARIARLNPDGSVDVSFNQGSTAVGGTVNSLAIQADGKILMGGAMTSSVARLNANGTRDTSFNPGSGANAPARSVALQADGKIVLSGRFTTFDGTTRNAIARLNNDIATQALTVPDSTKVQWNRGGAGPEISQVTFSLSTDGGNTWILLGSARRIGVTSNWELTGLSLPSSGLVRGSGRTISGYQSGSSGLVQEEVPYSAAGTVDAAYDPNVTAGDCMVSAMALQPDGKLIIGGIFSNVGGVARTNLARLETDGKVDAGFAANTAGPNYEVSSVAVQVDGKIVLGGDFTTVAGKPRNYFARLDAQGLLDSNDGFNQGIGANAPVNGAAVQADGKILLAGDFTTVNGTPCNRIARFETSGNLDPGFHADAHVNGEIFTVAVQADGRIVIGGGFTAANYHNLARLNADGSLDTTFAADVSAWVSSVVLQADGQIVLGGAFTTVNGAPHKTLARLDALGKVDATFNPQTNGYVSGLALQTDGKILLGGFFSTVNGTPHTSIARLTPNGSVDSFLNASTDEDGTVYGMAVQADGKIVLGGTFTSVNGTARSRIARLNNDAAIQTLTVPDSTRVQWSRGGTAPEVSQVTFEQSTDDGANWTLLPGRATRIVGTGNWQLTGLTLPANVGIRARGRTAGGILSSSPGLIQEVSPLEKLKEGNARYASEKMLHPNQSAEKRKEVAKGQHPFAVIVGCADSRVPPEIVFDQGLGDLFVIRIAGEVVEDSALGSIEYAVEHLHAGLIVVLGHERCGAVAAAVEAVEYGTEFDQHIKTLVDAIKPAVEHVKDKPGDILENSVKQNATEVAHKLMESEPVIKEAVEAGTLGVVTGYYDLDTGVVTFYSEE